MIRLLGCLEHGRGRQKCSKYRHSVSDGHFRLESAHVRHSRLQAPILIADHPGGRAKVQVGGQSGHNVAAGQLVVIWLTSVITQFPAARL